MLNARFVRNVSGQFNLIAWFALSVASYADVLRARHAIFLPHVGEED